MMKSFLRKIDMFGTPAKLNTFGQASYKTALGGILTLLAMVTILLFSYLFGTDFYKKENPRVVLQDKVLKKNEPYFLKTARDPFMLRQSDGSLRVLDYSKLPTVIQGRYMHMKKDKEGTWNIVFSAYSLVPCTQTKIHENKEIVNSLILSEWYCFDWDFVTKLGREAFNDPKYEAQLMGSQDDGEYTAFRMDVQNYQSHDPNNKFKVISTYEQAGAINETIVTLKYSTTFFNADEDTPMQRMYKEEDHTITRDQRYSSRQYLKRLTVNDDRHWMLKEVRSEEGLMPDEIQPNFIPADFVTKKWQSFYTKFFYLAKKELIVTRQYMKVQELSAIVGGFIKIVFLNSSLIIQLYSGFYVTLFYLSQLSGAGKEKSYFCRN